MDELFSYGWPGIKKFFRKNLISILYTLIFHLVVLIILIFVRVEGLKRDQELGIKLEFEEKTVEDILEDGGDGDTCRLAGRDIASKGSFQQPGSEPECRKRIQRRYLNR